MGAEGDISLGELEIRPHERVALVNGRDVALTSAEFDIVLMLAEHPGWVYSADQLAGDPVEAELSRESVSVLMSRIRHRLAEAGLPDVVETVRGFGYRLHAPSGAAIVPGRTDTVTCALRDAAWQLQETVIEVEHSGTVEQKCEATEALDAARRAIHSALAE